MYVEYWVRVETKIKDQALVVVRHVCFVRLIIRPRRSVFLSLERAKSIIRTMFSQNFKYGECMWAHNKQQIERKLTVNS